VLKKIEQIVREEQDRAGAVELLMPTLQLADLWRESGRYDAYGTEMLRIQDRHERENAVWPTNVGDDHGIFRPMFALIAICRRFSITSSGSLPRRAAPRVSGDRDARVCEFLNEGTLIRSRYRHGR
jgi:hypothetical protein